MLEGESYGLNNKGIFDLQTYPTPNKENLPFSCDSKKSEDVTINLKSGFYTNETTLKILNDTCDIFYSLNGSEPTYESLKWKASLKFKTNSIITLRRLSKNKLPSKSLHLTLIFDKKSNLPTFSIITPDK